MFVGVILYELSGLCNSDENKIIYITVAAAVTVVLSCLLFIILLGIIIKKGELKIV